MYLKLRDTAFVINRTKLKCYYYDEAEASRWANRQPGLFLTAAVGTEERELNGESCAPWLRHNFGIKVDIAGWTGLEGKCWVFGGASDENNNEAGFFGVYEEEPLKECRFEILKRDGREFTVRWSGVADMFFDEEYDCDVPFECEFTAEFAGIGIQQCVADQTEAGLRAALGEIIDLDDFQLVTTPIGLKEFIFK